MNKFFNPLRSRAARLAAVAAIGASTVAAQAQTAATTFDPSTYTASITGTIAGLLAIGGAVFAVILAIKTTKWARRAL